MIKPWLFEFFASYEGIDSKQFDAQRCQADYQWHLQRWLECERAGFEGIFFSEHHFVRGRYSPSPNLLIATIAAHTQRLRLGVMGNVVPLYEPWRLAEEYSMLDQLSAGRLEIGFSSGIGPKEFMAIGMSPDEIKPRFAEGLDIIDALLTREQYSHQGTFWKFGPLRISPRPLQQPSPPRWLTGLSAPTATLAAQRGYKFCTGFITVQQAIDIFDAYRTAAAAAGHPAGPEQLGLRRQILIADDDASARAAAAAATQEMRARMSGRPPSAAPEPGTAKPGFGSIAPDAPSQPRGGPLISDDESIAGSPSSVVEQIVEQCRRMGAGHILAYPFGTLPRALVQRSHQLWPEVIAQLRRANVSR